MKLVKLLLAAVMTLILSSYCYADVGIVRIGDTDLDNAVTASDAAYLLQKTLISTFPLPAEEKYPNSFMTFSDADGDGSITASDSAAVLQKTLIGTYILPITDILKSGLYKYFSDNINAVLSDDGEHIVISEKENDKPHILIVYFSRAGENWQVGNVEKGNTAVIEEYVEKNINADVFEIRPETPYPESYNETLSIVTRERDNNESPDYIGKIDDLDQYDTVFLGYPIWYGGLPMIMYTFLENNDLGGKTIIPFSTHGGSGWGSTLSELKKLCPNSEFKDGFSIAGTNARNTDTETKVKEWINGLDIIKNDSEEQAVLDALYKRNKAMIDKDMTVLDALIDDDIVIRHMTGITQTKQEWLKDIENEELRYYKIDILDPVVTINGNTAEISYTSILDANAYGAYSSS